MIKKYIDKNGNERIYKYNDSKYNKKNRKEHHEIIKLQQKKSYYKEKGELDKVKALDIMINLEKRKEKSNEKN